MSAGCSLSVTRVPSNSAQLAKAEQCVPILAYGTGSVAFPRNVHGETHKYDFIIAPYYCGL